MAAGLRATAKAGEHPPEPKVGAPVLDPTKRAQADGNFEEQQAAHACVSQESRARRARPDNRRGRHAVISRAFEYRFVITCPSVRPIVRATRWPRTDPQSTVFPVQLCRR